MEPVEPLRRLVTGWVCETGRAMRAGGTSSARAARAAAPPPRLVAIRGDGGPAARPAPPLVVFLGVGDDARSRMAAALLAHRAGGRARAISLSAGRAAPDAVVLEVLAEAGVDLRACRSRPPSARLLGRADAVVVMGYDGQVEVAGAALVEDWCIDDPRGKGVDAVRCIRDALDRRAQRLLVRLGVGTLVVRRG
jgi:arsenate reductase